MPFLAREPPGRQERVAVGDAHVLVDDRRVEGVGKRVLADALDEVGMDAAPPREDRALGIGADDDDVRLLLLQVAARCR